jgi:hypothetical protein
MYIFRKLCLEIKVIYTFPEHTGTSMELYSLPLLRGVLLDRFVSSVRSCPQPALISMPKYTRSEGIKGFVMLF